MDESGKVLKRERVRSTPDGFRQSLGAFGHPIQAVLEASYCWGPMFDWLDEVADEVVLAHPSKVRAIAEARIKTDKIDSETLAHLLRADLIPRAYAPSKEVRAIKRVLRQRLFLVQLRTMVKNRIRALLAQHAVEVPKLIDLFGKRGFAWLRQIELPGPDGSLLPPAVRSSAKLRAQYQRMKIRRGAKDARTAIARKLAELAWIVWTERRCYEER